SGASITSGELDPISLAGVDFGRPGLYTVSVTGHDGARQAAPVTLYVTVVAAPVITLANPVISVPVGTTLTLALVLASAQASISSGTLNAVDLTGVRTDKAATYGVSVTGADQGIAATPRNLVIQVTAPTPGKPVAKPVASRSVLTVTPRKVRAPKRV